MRPQPHRHNRLLKVLLVGYGPVACALAEGLCQMPQVTFIGQACLGVVLDHKWPQFGVPSVNHFEFACLLARLQPDLVLVASWGERFSPAVLATPHTAFLNCHGSLLPRHRGPNPYIATVLSADDTSGVTFHWMDAGFDTGPIALQAAFTVPPDATGGQLQSQAAQVATSLLPALVEGLLNETLPTLPQSEEEASYEAMPTTLAQANWADSAEGILRHCRAISPWFKLSSQIGGCPVPFSQVQTVAKASSGRPGIILDCHFPWLEVSVGESDAVIRAKVHIEPGFRGWFNAIQLRLRLWSGVRFDARL